MVCGRREQVRATQHTRMKIPNDVQAWETRVLYKTQTFSYKFGHFFPHLLRVHILSVASGSFERPWASRFYVFPSQPNRTRCFSHRGSVITKVTEKYLNFSRFWKNWFFGRIFQTWNFKSFRNNRTILMKNSTSKLLHFFVSFVWLKKKN